MAAKLDVIDRYEMMARFNRQTAAQLRRTLLACMITHVTFQSAPTHTDTAHLTRQYDATHYSIQVKVNQAVAPVVTMTTQPAAASHWQL